MARFVKIFKAKTQNSLEKKINNFLVTKENIGTFQLGFYNLSITSINTNHFVVLMSYTE